ncbi:dihydroneopterin aldolase [Tianweitania sediminis]|nr:dihydroneopterin aldolase [Tianweitania sediminis]
MNCAFFARHGVLEEEARLGQRFFVDAVLHVEGGDAVESDLIEGTVHYGQAFQRIEHIVTTTRRALIETLALDIAQSLCAGFPQIQVAEVTVRKPSAPVPGVLDYVETTVRWPADG